MQAEFFGCDFVGMDLSIADFGDAGWSGDSDFVEAIAAVDDECAAQAQHAEGFGKFFD